MKLKELPASTLPRERFISIGVENLNDEELLSIILGSGYKNINVKELSNELLKYIKDLKNLKDYSIYELMKIKGIGLSKAITLIASLELGKRVLYTSNDEVLLNSTDKIFDFIKSKFLNQKQELFYVIYLDKQYKLITYKMLFKGSVDYSLVHPREIFKYAVSSSATSFVLVHNHPSGSLTPSQEDIEITDNILYLSRMMGIKLLDHLIIGNNDYLSFKKEGIIK